MTIAYLCGENSIWKINNIALLEAALEAEGKELVRHIQESPFQKGAYTVKYIIITKEEFFKLQLKGEDVLLYFKEDIASQIKRLKNKN